MRSDSERLRDILEAVESIRRRVPADESTFLREELLQTWVVHHLQIIGEASRGFSQPFLDKHPETPWAKIVAMRNILVHEYFGLNLTQVWRVVTKELPILKRKFELPSATWTTDLAADLSEGLAGPLSNGSGACGCGASGLPGTPATGF